MTNALGPVKPEAALSIMVSARVIDEDDELRYVLVVSVVGIVVIGALVCAPILI